MDIRITPAPLAGNVKAIASKSRAHRLLIAAALADGPVRILCGERSRDIDATAGCLQAMGCGLRYEDGAFLTEPIGRQGRSAPEEAELDCGESGSTLRFLLPVVTALGIRARIRMHGRLPERPLSPLWEELTAHGAELIRLPDGSILTGGKLRGGDFVLAADVSSQFISGLLFALPLLEEESSLRLTGRVESRGYIEMTKDALQAFGVRFTEADGLLRQCGKGGYITPGEIEVEGDWSNGAFWICVDELCRRRSGRGADAGVRCTGLREDSAQGDRRVMELKEQILAGGAVVDAADVPDLVPVLAVLAAGVRGDTVFTNIGRLRIKESDRVQSVAGLLTDLGGSAEDAGDRLIVHGRGSLKGGSTNSRGDHRIAMSAAVASCICREPVLIRGAEAVEKSYPRFWEDFVSLGGKIERAGQI